MDYTDTTVISETVNSAVMKTGHRYTAVSMSEYVLHFICVECVKQT